MHLIYIQVCGPAVQSSSGSRRLGSYFSSSLSLTVLETLQKGKDSFSPRELPGMGPFQAAILLHASCVQPSTLLPTRAVRPPQHTLPRVLICCNCLLSQRKALGAVFLSQPQDGQAELRCKGSLLCFTLGETEALLSPRNAGEPQIPVARGSDSTRSRWGLRCAQSHVLGAVAGTEAGGSR